MLRKAAVLLIAFLLSIVAAPAIADEFFGLAECGSAGGPGCDVSAESGGDSPETPPEGGGPSSSGDTGGLATGVAVGEPACESEDGELVGCLGLPQAEGEEDGEAPVEEVDFEALAYQAYASFSLSSPQISMSPSAEAPVLVQVPVWMWVDADDWESETATASVPGGSVTVTATPSLVSWDMGDGQSVDCEGPGTAYDASVHDPAAASPDCGHTYTSTSGGTVDLSVQMSWDVEWESSTGEGGALPVLTTETSTTVQVVESSGLVTTTR